MGAMGKYEALGSEKDWSKADFADFANALKGSDNINTAPFAGEYPERAAFLKALVDKAGINEKGLVSAPDRVQPGTVVTKDGNIYIENLGPTETNYLNTTGIYKTWTIKPDFSVTEGTKPYISYHNMNHDRLGEHKLLKSQPRP